MSLSLPPLRSFLALAGLSLAAALAAAACSGPAQEQAGQPCDAPADCYPNVDPAELAGEVVCIDRVPQGYCSHRCQADADCCAADGECDIGLSQVCAPLESSPDQYCFLSCEAADVGSEDPGAYCLRLAGAGFGCRSTGGGANNRKICLPN